MDIHHYDRKYELALTALDKSNLSTRNKTLIQDFHNALILENLSKPRLVKYLRTLTRIATWFETDLDNVTENDLKRSVATIQQRSDYSSWTKRTYKIILRRFFVWLSKERNTPDITTWMNMRISRSEMKLPSEGDLLTPREAHQLIDAATHPRDKALLSALWESGSRISEVGNLSLRHIQFDRYGTVISVRGKTGSRKIRLVTSTPHLSTWISCHPQKGTPDAPLWVNIGNTNRGKKMDYGAIRKLLLTLAEKIGLKKRVNPHSFRHSRATHMASSLTEFQMNQYFGWIQGSNMPAIYVHMSGKEVDKAVLAMHGIQEEKRETIQEQAHMCPRCETINDTTADYCHKCGAILDEKKAIELEEAQAKEQATRKLSDDIMNQLFSDDDVQELIRKKLRALKPELPAP